MELKKAFFKQVAKGDEINKQNSFLKNLINEKIKSLSEFENGKLILEKRKLIESLDSLCKEVKQISISYYFIIFFF